MLAPYVVVQLATMPEGKLHGPGDIFFDFVEAAVVIDDGGVGGDVRALRR